MKEVFIRTAAGIVFIAIVVAAMFYQESWYLLMIVAAFTGWWEFSRMAAIADPLRWIVPLLSLGVAVSFYDFGVSVPPVAWLLIPGLLITFLLVQVTLEKFAQALLGVAWIFGGFLFLAILYPAENAVIFLTSFFGLIWVNDILAFVCGKLMGKHKIAPQVSPGKTWEGTLGGMTFTMIFALLIPYWNDALTWMEWMGAAGLISLSSLAGDLFESKVKRNYGVKDSGKLIPGHGGILDRFDSAIFAAPVFLFYLSLMRIV